ncbi:MAG TPA: hypothetical protein EYO59_03340 [Chromatiaceae bacterium]|nr:hypothetical protein [Chromatiaceae bacterium]
MAISDALARSLSEKVGRNLEEMGLTVKYATVKNKCETLVFHDEEIEYEEAYRIDEIYRIVIGGWDEEEDDPVEGTGWEWESEEESQINTYYWALRSSKEQSDWIGPLKWASGETKKTASSQMQKKLDQLDEKWIKTLRGQLIKNKSKISLESFIEQKLNGLKKRAKKNYHQWPETQVIQKIKEYERIQKKIKSGTPSRQIDISAKLSLKARRAVDRTPPFIKKVFSDGKKMARRRRFRELAHEGEVYRMGDGPLSKLQRTIGKNKDIYDRRNLSVYVRKLQRGKI